MTDKLSEIEDIYTKGPEEIEPSHELSLSADRKAQAWGDKADRVANKVRDFAADGMGSLPAATRLREETYRDLLRGVAMVPSERDGPGGGTNLHETSVTQRGPMPGMLLKESVEAQLKFGQRPRGVMEKALNKAWDKVTRNTPVLKHRREFRETDNPFEMSSYNHGTVDKSPALSSLIHHEERGDIQVTDDDWKYFDEVEKSQGWNGRENYEQQLKEQRPLSYRMFGK
jgi:hypothetical protein